MPTTLEYIQTKCPGLNADPDLNIYIDAAKLSICPESYGTKYNYALALMACHNYTVSKQQQNAGGGKITSMRNMDRAVSYGSNSSNVTDDYLGLSNYGLELLSLQKGTLNRFGVTGSNNIYRCG